MKHIQRFFVTGTLDEGDQARLEGDDSFHASSVLRLKPGDAIELADAGGRVFSSVITRSGKTVEARVQREQDPGEADGLATVSLPGGDGSALITVVQALPAGKKMDLVVEKLSELGVARLVPVSTERSVTDGEVSNSRRERWDRIARSAAAQARRNLIMKIGSPCRLEEWLEVYDGPTVALVTEVEAVPLGMAVKALDGDLALLVGPEAGFTPAEIELLKASDASLAGLGPMLLRTETAALVAAAIIMHRKGVIG